LPLLLALLGVFPLVTGHLEVTARHARIVLDGLPARAAGLAPLALGFCMHVYSFWRTDPNLSRHATPALAVSVLVFLGSLGYALSALLF
jgi:hypothetical protein